MSLQGRYVIDRLKWFLTHKLHLNWSLPVPPYDKPEFWEKAYQNMNGLHDNSIPEWGNVGYHELHEYQYRLLELQPPEEMGEQHGIFGGSKGHVMMPLPRLPQKQETRISKDSDSDKDKGADELIQTTLMETLGLSENVQRQTKEDNDTTTAVTPTQQQQQQRRVFNATDDEPVIMLGCGTSTMALDMWESGHYKGPMIQVDIASRIVEIMAQQYAHLMQTGDMYVLQDDATQLSSIAKYDENHSSTGTGAAACIDKGLMDALFCCAPATMNGMMINNNDNNDDESQCHQVLQAVHRTLRPNGIFLFYSLSRPEFWMPTLQRAMVVKRHHGNQQQQRQQHNPNTNNNNLLWQDVQVRHDMANGMLLYRLQKADKMTVANQKLNPKGRGGRRR